MRRMIAAEIAVYLAQSTDLPGFVEEIAGRARQGRGSKPEFTPLDEPVVAIEGS